MRNWLIDNPSVPFIRLSGLTKGRDKLMRKSVTLLFVGVLLAGCKAAVSEEPKASEAEAIASIRKFSQIYQTILNEFLEPVSEDALVDSAIAGMYEAGKLEQPTQYRPVSKPAGGKGVSLQRLGRLSAAYGDVDARSNGVSGPQLWEAAIDRMVGSLDPQSSYLDADSFAALGRSAGRVGAIGVGIKVKQESLIIDYVIPDTPADSAGLKPGEEIVEIEGESLAGKSTIDAVRMLRGYPGSEVALVMRDHGKTRSVRIIRERLTAENPKFECRFSEQNVLYIRPYGLAVGLNRALGKLMKALDGTPVGMPDRVILDLRGNSGGVLGEAVGVADLFLKSGTIATIQTRKPKDGMNFSARHGGDFEYVGQVTILVDKNTASGAELIAAALKDHQRARIIGEHTGRYGTVQTILPMRDGSAIKLTTSRVIRPSRKPLADGVEPDVGVSEENIENYSLWPIAVPCP